MHRYDKLSQEFIDALHSPTPDFGKARDLLQQGVDINTGAPEDYSTLLTESIAFLIDDYGETATPEDLGNALVSIVRFFLENGYDVSRCDRKYGALALWQLMFSIETDHILEAAKLLLAAGADSSVILDPEEKEDVAEQFFIEADFQYSCKWNDNLGNIFQALAELLLNSQEIKGDGDGNYKD